MSFTHVLTNSFHLSSIRVNNVSTTTPNKLYLPIHNTGLVTRQHNSSLEMANDWSMMSLLRNKLLYLNLTEIHRVQQRDLILFWFSIMWKIQ